MSSIEVRVVRQDGGGTGDPVFVDCDYIEIAGLVGSVLTTDPGQHIFESPGPDGRHWWRKVQTVKADDEVAGAAETIVLSPYT